MLQESGEVQLEKILRANLISAYLDYMREFGERKARKVCEEVCQSASKL